MMTTMIIYYVKTPLVRTRDEQKQRFCVMCDGPYPPEKAEIRTPPTQSPPAITESTMMMNGAVSEEKERGALITQNDLSTPKCELPSNATLHEVRASHGDKEDESFLLPIQALKRKIHVLASELEASIDVGRCIEIAHCIEACAKSYGLLRGCMKEV